MFCSVSELGVSELCFFPRITLELEALYLVSGEVLLVAGATLQHSQTVLAQQVFGVGVNPLKVSPQA